MVISLWVIVGLFWAVIIANAVICRTANGRAWHARTLDRAAFMFFDAVEWVWTKVLGRKSLRPNDDDFVAWLNSKGIRSWTVPGANGSVAVYIHEDDQVKLAAMFNDAGLTVPPQIEATLTRS
jgi:hypothetical protein